MKLAILIMATLAAASAMYVPTEQASKREERGAIVDMAAKIDKMIDNIKQILSSGSEKKRDLVDAKEKMESVLDEIKKMFKSDSRRGVFVDYATKIQTMITNIKDILSNKSSVGKRNLVDLAKKLEKVVGIYHEVKAFATVAYDVYELVVDIKNMFSDEKSDEHKDLVDVASRIEEILKDTAIFLHTESEESSETVEKRGLIEYLKDTLEDYEYKFFLNYLKHPQLNKRYDGEYRGLGGKRGLVEYLKDTLEDYEYKFWLNYLKHPQLNKRDIGDWDLVKLTNKLKSLVNIYHEVKAFATVAYDVYELAGDIKDMFADEKSEEHKDLVDIARRIEEIVEDTVTFLHSGTEESSGTWVKRGNFHDVDDMFNKWTLPLLKDWALKHNNFESKDASETVEKRGFVENLKDEKWKRKFIENLKDFLKDNEGKFLYPLLNKRDIGDWDLVKLTNKLKSLVNIYHEVKAFATVAYDVYELAGDIKDMFADENSEEHKDLVDIARRIEEIVEDTVIFLHTGTEETPKRDVASWLGRIEKIKAQNVSRRDLVNVATKVEAIIAELKKVFDSSKTAEKRALSGMLKDAFETVGSKILDIIEPMVDWAMLH